MESCGTSHMQEPLCNAWLNLEVTEKDYELETIGFVLLIKKQKMKITGKKFLILILYCPVQHSSENYPIEGRTRLIKIGFLFDQEMKKDFEKDKKTEVVLPEFTSGKYGPFSKGLMIDIEFLKNRNYINVANGKSTPTPEELAEYMYWIEDIENVDTIEYISEVFTLSEKGIIKAEQFWQELTINQKETLITFKTKLVNAPLYRILEYVYKKYKDTGYINNSLIRDKFL